MGKGLERERERDTKGSAKDSRLGCFPEPSQWFSHNSALTHPVPVSTSTYSFTSTMTVPKAMVLVHKATWHHMPDRRLSSELPP
jgi:hypothetical protein